MSVEELLWNVLPMPAAGGLTAGRGIVGFGFLFFFFRLLLWRPFLYVLGQGTPLPQCPPWKGSGAPQHSQEMVEVTHLINICPKILP